jgi:hypothetical protein
MKKWSLKKHQQLKWSIRKKCKSTPERLFLCFAKFCKYKKLFLPWFCPKIKIIYSRKFCSGNTDQNPWPSKCTWSQIFLYLKSAIEMRKTAKSTITSPLRISNPSKRRYSPKTHAVFRIRFKSQKYKPTYSLSMKINTSFWEKLTNLNY